MLVGAALGESAAETGRRLYISEATVKWTRVRARERLDARNLTHAVALALKRDLLG